MGLPVYLNTLTPEGPRATLWFSRAQRSLALRFPYAGSQLRLFEELVIAIQVDLERLDSVHDPAVVFRGAGKVRHIVHAPDKDYSIQLEQLESHEQNSSRAEKWRGNPDIFRFA